MKTKRIVLLCFLAFLFINAKSQSFTDSNLPIVVIETDNGVNIPDEPKVLGTMKIIWHQDGSRNYMSDIDNPEFLNYDGRIGIERRGSSSQTYSNKKPYALETLQDDNVTNNNVSIFNMPEENDWILNSLAYDQTGMRDFLAYELSEALGQYASRRQYCEVVINGDYKGLYVFMEKIKPDKGRVNIEKMDETCNQYPEVTGGYIVKADKTTGGPGQGSHRHWREKRLECRYLGYERARLADVPLCHREDRCRAGDGEYQLQAERAGVSV